MYSYIKKQSFAKLLRDLPSYSTFTWTLVIEDSFFENLEAEFITNFKRTIINLQNIDDRYIFEWNNIRIINKQEKDVHNYVLLKDTMKDNKLVSLNMNNNGISIMGTSDSNNNLYGSEDNQDKSLTKFEVNKDNNKQSIYQKDIGIMNMNDLEQNVLDELKKKRYLGYDLPMQGYNSLVTNPNEYKSYSFKSDSNLRNYNKYLNDPTVQKMENYIDKTSILKEYYNSLNDKKINKSYFGYEDLRFKEKKNRLDVNPCFNKGYYNQDLNIAGHGNYTECMIYIKYILPNHTVPNVTYTTLDHKILNALKHSNNVYL
jgi:hypothetical protein